MKVTVIGSMGNDWNESLDILIDGEKVFSARDGELEDNSLSRNFKDCHSIPNLLKRAWEAGMGDEKFEIEYVSGNRNE